MPADRHELRAGRDADVVVVKGGDAVAVGVVGRTAEGPRATTVLAGEIAPDVAISHGRQPPGDPRRGEENVVARVGVGRPGEAEYGKHLHEVAVEVDDARLGLHGGGELQRAHRTAHESPALRDEHVPVGVDADPHTQFGPKERCEPRIPGGVDKDVIGAPRQVGGHRGCGLRTVPELQAEAGRDQKWRVVQVRRRVVEERQGERGRGVELIDADTRSLTVAKEIGPTATGALVEPHRLLKRGVL